MYTDVIILAGGSGTRLWPASRKSLPKQFLPAQDGLSFFGIALRRGISVLQKQGILLVVAGDSHRDHVLREFALLDADDRARCRLLPEHLARNTAPAAACAVSWIAGAYGSGRRAIILTSDHLISPLQTFGEDAAAAAELAAAGNLVVFGIPPTRAETGYGYIEQEAAIPSDTKGRCFIVASFREKPDLNTAEQFLAKGSFLWNSGMFAFDVDTLINLFNSYAKDSIAPFAALETPDPQACSAEGLIDWPALDTAWQQAKAISFDYAIAEKAEQVAVVRASFDWVDVGSWDEYIELRSTSSASMAPVFSASSSGCEVDSDIPVALCGVEDLIVVARAGKNGEAPSLLICRKGQTQLVKEIVESIKKTAHDELL